jgi:hypothetical protein
VHSGRPHRVLSGAQLLAARAGASRRDSVRARSQRVCVCGCATARAGVCQTGGIADRYRWDSEDSAMPGITTFRSVTDALDAGYQICERIEEGYLVRIRTRSGWAMALVLCSERQAASPHHRR